MFDSTQVWNDWQCRLEEFHTTDYSTYSIDSIIINVRVRNEGVVCLTPRRFGMTGSAASKNSTLLTTAHTDSISYTVHIMHN